MTHKIQYIHTLNPGDVVRWTNQDPWVVVLKVKADNFGHDVLYDPQGAAPRWRGFDTGDKVIVKSD